MLLFVGQVPRAQRGREAFQDIDVVATFGPLAKWAVEVDDPTRIGEIVTRAFATAVGGRPGPVVVALPEDILTTRVSGKPTAPAVSARIGVDPAALEAYHSMLAESTSPIVIVGGGHWNAVAAHHLVSFAECNGVPIVTDFRCQDFVDHRSAHYVGDTGFRMTEHVRRAIVESDLILALGTRLGELATGGYELLNVPRPRQRLVHVYPDAAELGRVYRADLPVVADPAQFASLLTRLELTDKPQFFERTHRLRAEYLADRALVKAPAYGVDLAAAIGHVRQALPNDAIVTNGAGNSSDWLHAFFEFRQYGTQLAARNGSKGYGLPAAIAAKLVHPDRIVVAYVGDGDFLMSAQELATAMIAEVPLVILVVNNAMYGTIRMHQEQAYPGRVSGTNLFNPDFAAFARSFGAEAEVVETTADFAAAFDRAIRSAKTTLIELRVDPNLIAPKSTIADLHTVTRVF
jgi:acetolactate synthase-1/2/3 large subunit